jgi:predicted transposase/invertase (TIGR01784 family)
MKEGMKKGIEQGVTQGIEKGKLETAKAMLAEGFDIKTIVKITGLTEEMILQ